MFKLQVVFILIFFSQVNMSFGQEKQSESKNATVKSKSYELVMADLKDRWTAIRFHTRTGVSSIIVNDIWVQIKEGKAFKPKSNARFVVKLAPFGTENKFAAMRMDKKSGTSWFLKDRRWIPIPEFDE